MGELKFALKCLVVTALLVMLSQVQVGNNTIEEYAQNWLRNSKPAQFVQNAAHGGVRLIQDGLHMGSKMITKSEVLTGETQRASRFNFEIKRSVSSQKTSESEKHLPRQGIKSTSGSASEANSEAGDVEENY